jgi:hypothetical protein
MEIDNEIHIRTSLGLFHTRQQAAVIERLTREVALSKNERILFAESARTHYLVANAFKLLADDKPTTEEWKRPFTPPEKRSMSLPREPLSMFGRRCNKKHF